MFSSSLKNKVVDIAVPIASVEDLLAVSMVLSYHLDYLQILHQLKLFIHFAFCDSAKRAIFKKGNFQYPS